MQVSYFHTKRPLWKCEKPSGDRRENNAPSSNGSEHRRLLVYAKRAQLALALDFSITFAPKFQTVAKKLQMENSGTYFAYRTEIQS